MKWSTRISVVVCVFVLLMPAVVLAAGPDSGGGWGGGGGKSDEGVLYGDLYVMLRDGNGVPLVDVNNHNCPTPVYVDADGVCRGITMAYDEETGYCEVPEGMLDFVVPVETGRLSLARTTQDVMDHAYTEAVKNIQNALDIQFDPSFRIVLTLQDPDTGEIVDKTIDSPLENLAVYQRLMRDGYLESITTVPMSPDDEPVTFTPCDNSELSEPFPWFCEEEITSEDLESAVSLFAAAADKSGGIYLDMLININSNLGLNGDDPSAPEYYDFSSFGQDNRRARYGLVDPVELLVGSYDSTNPLSSFLPENEIWFRVESVPISNVPFTLASSCKSTDINGSGPSGPYGPADYFTQAAEDARAVIFFLHNWSLPEYE